MPPPAVPPLTRAQDPASSAFRLAYSSAHGRGSPARWARIPRQALARTARLRRDAGGAVARRPISPSGLGLDVAVEVLEALVAAELGLFRAPAGARRSVGRSCRPPSLRGGRGGFGARRAASCRSRPGSCRGARPGRRWGPRRSAAATRISRWCGVSASADARRRSPRAARSARGPPTPSPCRRSAPRPPARA